MKLHLTPQELRLVKGMSEGVNLKQAAFLVGIKYSSAKVYMGNARLRNHIATQDHLMFLYGREVGESAALELRRSFSSAADVARVAA